MYAHPIDPHRFPRARGRRRIVAAVAAVAVVGTLAAAGPASAAGVTPAQLTAAGWTCIQPLRFPELLLCTPPGVGLPPLPGTPGFADRAPSYELLVFGFATGAYLGTQLDLRPDIYQQGQPPCPHQPGGQFIYNPRNDLWFCNRLGTDPSA
jgi:hypothetical protein